MLHTNQILLLGLFGLQVVVFLLGHRLQWHMLSRRIGTTPTRTALNETIITRVNLWVILRCHAPATRRRTCGDYGGLEKFFQ